MRFRSRYALLVVGALSVACQTNTTTVGTRPPAPQNLTYRLDPSGDPNNPAGILLSWDNDTTSSLASYNIYSRGSTTGFPICSTSSRRWTWTASRAPPATS